MGCPWWGDLANFGVAKIVEAKMSGRRLAYFMSRG